MTRAHQTEEVVHRHVEPLAVAPHLGAIGVEHLERLLLEGDGVAVDLLGVEHGAQCRAPGGVPHPAGEVADDQHHVVAGVLELTQFLEHHGVSEVNIRRGGVDPQLHPQRAPLRPGTLELSLQLALRERIDSVSLQEFRGFAGI